MRLCADTVPLSNYEQTPQFREHDGGRMTPTRTSPDTLTQVCREWRDADVRSCADMASLSEYEQPLSIRERDGGLSCQRDTDSNVTDTAVLARHSMVTRRHEVVRGYATAIRIRTTATKSRT